MWVIFNYFFKFFCKGGIWLPKDVFCVQRALSVSLPRSPALVLNNHCVSDCCSVAQRAPCGLRTYCREVHPCSPHSQKARGPHGGAGLSWSGADGKGDHTVRKEITLPDQVINPSVKKFHHPKSKNKNKCRPLVNRFSSVKNYIMIQ